MGLGLGLGCQHGVRVSGLGCYTEVEHVFCADF